MAIRSNLKLLHLQKEAREGRRITYREIKKTTGVAESTISAWMTDRIKNFYKETIERFCNFYNCLPGDLIIMESDDDGGGVA